MLDSVSHASQVPGNQNLTGARTMKRGPPRGKEGSLTGSTRGEILACN